MSRTRRSFSASEKLSIINEADQIGVSATLRKHNLSPTVFRRWKENFNEGGVANLQSYVKHRNPELEALEEQVRLLKNIVAKQQIELEFKTELLKKKSIPRAASVEVMQQFESHPMVSKQDLLSWSGVPRSSFLLQARRWFTWS